MARPRKDQQEPAAVERIKNAFWELLEENDLKHITVNMVTQKAHCNRGTFYYHYESLDALLCTVIEEELLNSKGLPLGIFYMLSNDSKALTEMLLPQRTQRFGLVMKRCGQECVALKIRTIIANMWQTILCDEEEELTTNARIIIEYSISGLIGVIDYLYREGKLDGSSFPEEMTTLSKTMPTTLPSASAMPRGSRSKNSSNAYVCILISQGKQHARKQSSLQRV